jgi:hypothetical protein
MEYTTLREHGMKMSLPPMAARACGLVTTANSPSTGNEALPSALQASRTKLRAMARQTSSPASSDLG